MAEIWLRYRDDQYKPTFHIRIIHDLDFILGIAEDWRPAAKISGGNKVQEALASFAGDVAIQVESGASEEEVEFAAARVLTMAVLWLTEFRNATRQMLEGATIECAMDRKTKAAMIHLSTPMNPLDPKIMSSSLEVDAFLADQRVVMASTNAAMGTDAAIIDELIALYGELVKAMGLVKTLHAVITGFAMSIRQDVAPAIALAMGGRPDAALAIARRALEIVGFARMIAEDPASAETWIFAHPEEKEAWEHFKTQFRVKNLFPKTDPFWHSVWLRYDVLAKLHHPNPQSFLRMEWEKTNDGRLKITSRQLQHSPEQVAENVAEVWCVLEIYALCLAALEKAIRAQVDTGSIRGRIVGVAEAIRRLSSHSK